MRNKAKNKNKKTKKNKTIKQEQTRKQKRQKQKTIIKQTKNIRKKLSVECSSGEGRRVVPSPRYEVIQDSRIMHT